MPSSTTSSPQRPAPSLAQRHYQLDRQPIPENGNENSSSESACISHQRVNQQCKRKDDSAHTHALHALPPSSTYQHCDQQYTHPRDNVHAHAEHLDWRTPRQNTTTTPVEAPHTKPQKHEYQQRAPCSAMGKLGCSYRPPLNTALDFRDGVKPPLPAHSDNSSNKWASGGGYTEGADSLDGLSPANVNGKQMKKGCVGLQNGSILKKPKASDLLGVGGLGGGSSGSEARARVEDCGGIIRVTERARILLSLEGEDEV